MSVINSIKTNDADWLEKAIKLYSQKQTFNFIDDAGIGFTEEDLKSAINLIATVKRNTKIPWKEIVAVLLGIGSVVLAFG